MGLLRILLPTRFVVAVATVLLACILQPLLRAQLVQYAPSTIFGTLPADLANRHGEARQLNAAEQAMVKEMIKAAEVYVGSHPDLAPALEAFRDCFGCDRMRIGNVLAEWWTLPDLVRNDGKLDRWGIPGAENPLNGAILLPNTLIIQPGQVGEMPGQIPTPPSHDPGRHCWNRARAILVVLHEGLRQLQIGIKENGNKDCNLILSIMRVYATDIRLLSDFLSNGVPIPSIPAGQRCPIELFKEPEAVAQLAAAYGHLADLCDEARSKGCAPLPPECN
jgi:hypothetical protein